MRAGKAEAEDIRTNVKQATTPFELIYSDAEAMDYIIKQFKLSNERGEYNRKLFRVLFSGSGTSFGPCSPYAHHKKREGKGHSNRLASPSPFLRRSSTHSGIPASAPSEQRRPETRHWDGYKAPYEAPYKMLQSYGEQWSKTAIQPHIEPLSTIYEDSAAL